MNPIPAMTEEDRSLRMEFEREWLKNSLAKMRSGDLDPADLSKLMHHYCQLKKEDNAQDKNLVVFTIAQSRLALAEARLTARRSRLRPSQGSPFGASFDSTSVTGYPDESDTDEAPPGSSECQMSTVDCQLSPADPDIDPEWSLAPWGRRKNGKPRTENEYRTILYRAVRDVYGLDLTESTDKPRPDQIAHAPGTSDASSSSPIPTSDIPPPTSDIRHPTSDIVPVPTNPDPDESPRSPFARDPPFPPPPRNPWVYF